MTRHPSDAPAAPFILLALTATCVAMAVLEPGWRLSCGLVAVGLAVGTLADWWYVLREAR